MALIQVTVIAGVFTAAQKLEIVERLTDAMASIEGESMRTHISCLVAEVASGDWALAAVRSPPTTSERSRALSPAIGRELSPRSRRPVRCAAG